MCSFCGSVDRALVNVDGDVLAINRKALKVVVGRVHNLVNDMVPVWLKDELDSMLPKNYILSISQSDDDVHRELCEASSEMHGALPLRDLRVNFTSGGVTTITVQDDFSLKGRQLTHVSADFRGHVHVHSDCGRVPVAQHAIPSIFPLGRYPLKRQRYAVGKQHKASCAKDRSSRDNCVCRRSLLLCYCSCFSSTLLLCSSSLARFHSVRGRLLLSLIIESVLFLLPRPCTLSYHLKLQHSGNGWPSRCWRPDSRNTIAQVKAEKDDAVKELEGVRGRLR